MKIGPPRAYPSPNARVVKSGLVWKTGKIPRLGGTGLPHCPKHPEPDLCQIDRDKLLALTRELGDYLDRMRLED